MIVCEYLTLDCTTRHECSSCIHLLQLGVLADVNACKHLSTKLELLFLKRITHLIDKKNISSTLRAPHGDLASDHFHQQDAITKDVDFLR
jgi:hypothetical protein